MSAYLVFTREATSNPAELAVYARQAPSTLEGHPGKILALAGRHETLEGDDPQGVAILEFPDPDAARAWYQSPVYQAARAHRFRGAKYRVLLIEGIKPNT